MLSEHSMHFYYLAPDYSGYHKKTVSYKDDKIDNEHKCTVVPSPTAKTPLVTLTIN